MDYIILLNIYNSYIIMDFFFLNNKKHSYFGKLHEMWPNYVMQNFSKSILMKKETHLHLRWPEGWVHFYTFFHFWENYFFNITAPPTLSLLLYLSLNLNDETLCLKFTNKWYLFILTKTNASIRQYKSSLIYKNVHITCFYPKCIQWGQSLLLAQKRSCWVN